MGPAQEDRGSRKADLAGRDRQDAGGGVMSTAPRYQFDPRPTPRQPVVNVGQAFGHEAPQAIEAEAAVLGSLIIEPSCYREVADIIDADAFTLQKHRTIFQ